LLVLARVEEDPALSALIAALPWSIFGDLDGQRRLGYLMRARESLHPHRLVVCRRQAMAAIIIVDSGECLVELIVHVDLVISQSTPYITIH
jgi:hypothetical protein